MAKYLYRYTGTRVDEYLDSYQHGDLLVAPGLLGLLAIEAPEHGQGKRIREGRVERISRSIQDEDITLVVGGSGQKWLVNVQCYI